MTTQKPNETQCNPVTKLMDMYAFKEEVQKVYNTVPNKEYVIIYFDLDNFKLYNSHYSRQKGDESLQFIARNIQSTFANQIVSHFGDDHFVVFAENENVFNKLKQLHETVSRYDDNILLELKAGVASISRDEKIFRTVDKARIACDTIKKTYDQYVCVYTEDMKDSLLTRKYIIDHVLTAIQQSQIEVVYMPITRIMTREVCGLEALARWNDPHYGMLSPSAFIETLENAHLIHLLDLEIARLVVRDIASHMKKNQPIVPVSINLSRVDFKVCDIVEKIEELVQEYNVPRKYIDIEVTERALSDDDGTLTIALKRFKQLGYKLWMDDFGSAFSSLNVLKDYAFDVLKIDMAFLISDSDASQKRGRIILKSVVNMAKDLGIQTLCEGIESEKDVAFLKSIGCEKGQGYYFGKPSSYSSIAAQFEKTLETAENQEILNLIGKHNLNTDIPTAIVKNDEDGFVIMHKNQSFLDFLSELHMDEENLQQQLTSNNQRVYDQLDHAIQHAIQSKQIEKVDVILNGAYCNLQIEVLAENSETDEVIWLLTATNVSDMSLSTNGGYLDAILRSIYALFERVDLFDIQSDVVHEIFKNTSRFDGDFDGKPIRESIQEYARLNVHESEINTFIQFYDMDSLVDRIRESGRNYMFRFFRTAAASGKYTWQVYVVISVQLDGKQMLMSACFDGDDQAILIAEKILEIKVEDPNAIVKENVDQNGVIISDEIFENLPFGIFWKDRNRRFMGANYFFKDYYGFQSDRDFVGKTDEEMGWHVDPNPFMNDEIGVIRYGRKIENEPGKCIAKGKIRDIRATKIPLKRKGEIVGLIGYFIDVTNDTQPIIKHDVLEKDEFITAYDIYQNAFENQNIQYGLFQIHISSCEQLHKKHTDQEIKDMMDGVTRLLQSLCGSDAAIAHMNTCQFTVLKQYGDEQEFKKLYHQIFEGIMREIGEEKMDVVIDKWTCEEMQNLSKNTIVEITGSE